MAKNHPRRCTMLAAALVAAGALALCGGADVQAGSKKRLDSSSKVKVTAMPSKAGGKQVITLNLQIEDGWYIYANPVGNEDFAANATTVSVKAGGKKVPARVEYPKGKVKTLDKDVFFIYQDKATVKVSVDENVSGPLEITIQVNSCSLESGQCLLPGKIELKVK